MSSNSGAGGSSGSSPTVIAARRRVAVTALLAALIVAPGCLRAEYGYEISADGGGRIELQIRFQEELIRTLEQVGLGDVV
ncbi:MAG: hypothetical protein ACKO5A_07975, partial [Actinomycetota bacterium]